MTRPIAPPGVGERSSTSTDPGPARADAHRAFSDFAGLPGAATTELSAFSAARARKLPGVLFARHAGSPLTAALGPRTAKTENDPTRVASHELLSPGEPNPGQDSNPGTHVASEEEPAWSQKRDPAGGPTAQPEPRPEPVEAETPPTKRASPRVRREPADSPSERGVAGAATPSAPIDPLGLVRSPARVTPIAPASPISGVSVRSPLAVPAAASQSIAREARAPRFVAAVPRRNSPVLAQVSRGIESALRHGGGAVTLHLRPSALGALRVRVEVREGTVSARFEASTPEARKLLGEQLPMLKAALEARGLSVDRLTVADELVPTAGEPAQEGPGSGLDPDGSGGDRGTEADDGGEPASETPRMDVSEPEESGDARTTPVRADGGVDALA